MLAFAGIFAAILAVLVVLGWRDAKTKYRAEQQQHVIRKGNELRDQLAIAFQEVHQYRAATPADWSGLDRRFYDDATAALAREGFVVVGELVDETLQAAFPRMRSVGRILLGDGGRVRVAVFHLKMTGWNRVLQAIGLIKRRLHQVECCSELEGTSRFLSTSNTQGLDQMTPPEAVMIERLPRTAGAAEVLARHRERMASLDRAVWHVMPDFDAVLRSVQRGNVVVARHRQGLGGLTEEELRALTGRPLTENEQLLLATVRQRASSTE